MFFELQHTDKKTSARVGRIQTDHGIIETPIFMPVGTAGTVKAVHQKELESEINASIILGNTYHLSLRPGLEVLKNAGGLHKFNGWNRSILSDSGGYQVYSLAHKRKIKEDGVMFQSHIDGSNCFFSPENVIKAERIIGADIIMAFDECPPYPAEYTYAQKSMELTHRWLDRCVDTFENTEKEYNYQQFLFPIVQGSIYEDLRKQSAEYISNKHSVGNAIGGLSVGEPAYQMYKIIQLVCNILPQNSSRYLMGVGTPQNILEAISLGVDMFDCVMPTRNGRNGMLFTQNGTINIKNEKWKHDFSPIDTEINSPVSSFYSKAYLRHLIIAKEILGYQIASIHNLSFYLWLVKTARIQILNGTFLDWKNAMLPLLSKRI
ncbi:MAG: tRNA guanosine(34) transglycosylase Tgt [Chitinophagaceae bacterium]|nr:tRNA guanosine(34) transglycosylase Tgt [Chitinophagaceae bacterium]